MTPQTLTAYRSLRASGWRAVDAFRTARYEPARTLLSELDIDSPVTWTERGYTLRASADYDEWSGNDEYGTFTDTAEPGVTIPNDRSRSDREYKHFRPEYSIADRIADNRTRGMTRDAARADAIRTADQDLRRALEAQYVVLTVTASRAGVELARDNVGGVDLQPDPAMPYALANKLRTDYLSEIVGDLAAEAIATADDSRPAKIAELRQTIAELEL